MSTSFDLPNKKGGSYAESILKRYERDIPYNFKNINHSAFINSLAGGAVKACSTPDQPVLKTFQFHQLIAAIKTAFNDHRPLILSPDAIWITIAQGLANHINENAESLRKKFVAHEGQKVIEIDCPNFVRGASDNNWTSTLDQFSQKIREYVGETTHKNIIADFSTTGPVEKAASEVVLMTAMQNYFEYRCSTLCGIPQITLEGTIEDWEHLRDKTRLMEGLDLDWWLASLHQVLDEFVNSAKGKINQYWWQSIYNTNNQSGGPYMAGWCTWLLPYTKTKNYIKKSDGNYETVNKLQRNPLMGDVSERSFGGLVDDSLPSALAKAPFIWNYYGQEFQYEFIAGLTGVVEDKDTKSVKPILGWAVREANKGLDGPKSSWEE